MTSRIGRGVPDPDFFSSSSGGQDAKVWSREEVLQMWPQSAGELQGFHAHLSRSAGITADQLHMALQLAQAEYERIKRETAG